LIASFGSISFGSISFAAFATRNISTSLSLRHLVGQLANDCSFLRVAEFAPQPRRQRQDLDHLTRRRSPLANFLRFLVTAPFEYHFAGANRTLEQFGRVTAVGFQQRWQGRPHRLQLLQGNFPLREWWVVRVQDAVERTRNREKNNGHDHYSHRP
jgi:hypothetical protein